MCVYGPGQYRPGPGMPPGEHGQPALSVAPRHAAQRLVGHRLRDRHHGRVAAAKFHIILLLSIYIYFLFE